MDMVWIAIALVIGQSALIVLLHRLVNTFGEYTRTLARTNASNENLLSELALMTGARREQLGPLAEWQEDQYHELREDIA